jgi:hypothetical protein
MAGVQITQEQFICRPPGMAGVPCPSLPSRPLPIHLLERRILKAIPPVELHDAPAVPAQSETHIGIRRAVVENAKLAGLVILAIFLPQ